MRCTGFAAIVMLLSVVVPALGDDDIASKMMNDPTAGWGAMGAGAKSELFKDPTVQGGMAERMTISGKSGNAWDFGAQVAIVKPLKQGDVLLLAFWAKAETPPAGSTAIDFLANIQSGLVVHARSPLLQEIVEGDGHQFG